MTMLYKSPSGSGPGFPSLPSPKNDIRRPSPWVDLAHSLSESTISPAARARVNSTSSSSPSSIPTRPISPSDETPQLSSSALREWDRLLSESSGIAKRHHLIHPSSIPDTGSELRHTGSQGSLGAPKLAAERDRDGHIEYKLKLIDPTPDRFERLVTQMSWRLKQGRNEAIYEIGLADDGTVIGLTRQEMDASLHTLEQMAAEVGATVLILKEIVLTSTVYPSSAGSSSALSLDSEGGGGGWMIRRPDLDEMGRPRKGSRSISSGKRIKSVSTSERGGNRDADGDEDIPQFDLELGDGSTAPMENKEKEKSKNGRTKSRWKKHPKIPKLPSIQLTPEAIAHRTAKSNLKALKSAERRETRRLELYKGDGTNPMWTEGNYVPKRPSTLRLFSPSPKVSTLPLLGHIPVSKDGGFNVGKDKGLVVDDDDRDRDESEADNFIADLLSVPLDNLSLSFSEVRTVIDLPSSSTSIQSSSPTSSPSSPTSPISSIDGDESATEYATSPSTLHRIPSPHTNNTHTHTSYNNKDNRNTSWSPEMGGEEMKIRGREMICVEALVVRKTAEGVAGVGEWCDDGDDVWGFGDEGDDDDEVDPDDGWDLGG